MNRTQIEALTLETAHLVLGAGGKLEDSRVELKREWLPDSSKVARRLAGHCNAARAPWVLWIIGLGEDATWREQSEPETHQWVNRVQSHFDGVAPALLLDLKVPIGDKCVTALVFDAQRGPYVWKVGNAEGASSGGVTLEVPWREGSRVRSARREELVRTIAPVLSRPTLDLVGGDMICWRDGTDSVGRRVSGQITFYIVPAGDRPTVLPLYKMQAVLSASTADWSSALGISTLLRMPGSPPDGLVTITDGEVIAVGPGRIPFDFGASPSTLPPRDQPSMTLSLTYSVAGDDRANVSGSHTRRETKRE